MAASVAYVPLMGFSEGQHDSWKLGIAIMTAWCEYQDGTPAHEQLLGSMLGDIAAEEGTVGVVRAAIGLQSVAGLLLMAFAKQHDVTPEEALRRIALSIENDR